MEKIIECVPNFSEGKNLEVVQKITTPFIAAGNVKLLDYSADPDHNRSVLTVIGEPGCVKRAMIEAAGIAIENIDLNYHTGEHPRIGAVDVIPFIPIKNVTMEEAVQLSVEAAQELSGRYGLPVFLYEKSARNPKRVNLADIRSGQFEGMREKIKTPEWKPDFGPSEIHPTAGAVAVGARMPLMAFNVNLESSDLGLARRIAKIIRQSSGGLPFVKALGLELKGRGIVQVSINMTDYTQTSLFRVFEIVKAEAAKFGVHVYSSEIIGLVPMQALADTAAYYLQIENFSVNRIIEYRLLE